MKHLITLTIVTGLTLTHIKAQSETSNELTFPRLMCFIQKETKPNEWGETVGMDSKKIVPNATTTLLLRQDSDNRIGATLSENGNITLFASDANGTVKSFAFSNEFKKIGQTIGVKLQENNELLGCTITQ